MSLLTPPNTSHRGDKENHFLNPGSRVVWSPLNQYHSLSSPPKASPKSGSSKAPAKSILKPSTFVLSPLPQNDEREVTPEPSDPLVDLKYLEYPVSRIISPNTPLCDLIVAYNVLAARLRSSVTGSTTVDASWPLFQPLRANSEAFVAAVVRDLGKALVDPAEAFKPEDGDCKDVAKFTLPSPQSSPHGQKKKRGMSAEGVKHARDLCTTCHSVLKLLAVVMTIPSIYTIFTDKQLGEMLTALLAIPISEELPTPNARKTCALAIWLLQVQRLPYDVLSNAGDRIAYALRRGLDGELGKEGKKGSASDGLKAIHDLSIYQPTIFIPSFTSLLPSVLAKLLAPTLALRVQACNALGGFALGCASIPHSYIHTRISNTVANFITTISATSKVSPTKCPEASVIRTLRTTIAATEPSHVAHGPVWGLSVLSSLIVLLGSAICTNLKVHRIVVALLSSSMVHKKSSVRALLCVVWRPVAWAYFQPTLIPDPDYESEVEADSGNGAPVEVRLEACRTSYWKTVQSLVAMRAGISTIAALLDESFLEGEEEGLRKTFKILNTMVDKSGQECEDAMETIQRMICSEEVSASEWRMSKLLPERLFSSIPGLLTSDFSNLSTTVKSIIQEMPTVEDIRCLTRDEIARDWVWDSFVGLWRKFFAHLKMGDLADVPDDLVKIWKALLKANLNALQEAEDDRDISDFASKAANILIAMIQDPDLIFTPGDSPVAPRQLNSDPPTPALLGPKTYTNGFLKIKVFRVFWLAMQDVFLHTNLVNAAEQMLACLMKSEQAIVGSDRKAQLAWGSLCMDVLSSCDVEAMRTFWGYEASDGEKPCTWKWSEETRSLLWRYGEKKWRDIKGHWEGAIILLSVPFTALNKWSLSNEESKRWESLLEYTTSKALDYGVDSIIILDNIAGFISQNESPTGTSSTRIADLLLSNLEIADAREIPERLMDFVCDTMRLTYPPEPHNKPVSMWMIRALTTVIEKCPLELCLRLLQLVEEGLCIWLSDEHTAWSSDELSYNIIPLYQGFLCRIQSLPEDTENLKTLAPILASVFNGRNDMTALVAEAFNDYWQLSYANFPTPEGGWPSEINTCLRMAGTQNPPDTVNEIIAPILIAEAPEFSREGLIDVEEVPEEISPPTPTTPRFVAIRDWNTNDVFIAETPRSPAVDNHSAPVTPMLKCSFQLTSPPRPRKASASSFVVPPRHPSPCSPLRIRIASLPSTPKRTPEHSLRFDLVTPTKRKSLHDEDKENISPRPLTDNTSITERVALGKRRMGDRDDVEDFASRKHAVSSTNDLPLSPAPCALSSNDIEEERQVTEFMTTAIDSSPILKKRKRVAEVVIKVEKELRSNTEQQHLRSAVSFDSAVKTLETTRRSSRLHTKPLKNTKSFSEAECQIPPKKKRRHSNPFRPSSPLPSLIIPGYNDHIKMNSRPTQPSNSWTESSEPPSSDDKPYDGQVTPHHIISPRPHNYWDMDVDDVASDPPTDDSTGQWSPTKDTVERRRRKMGTLLGPCRPGLF